MFRTGCCSAADRGSPSTRGLQRGNTRPTDRVPQPSSYRRLRGREHRRQALNHRELPCPCAAPANHAVAGIHVRMPVHARWVGGALRPPRKCRRIQSSVVRERCSGLEQEPYAGAQRQPVVPGLRDGLMGGAGDRSASPRIAEYHWIAVVRSGRLRVADHGNGCGSDGRGAGELQHAPSRRGFVDHFQSRRALRSLGGAWLRLRRGQLSNE